MCAPYLLPPGTVRDLDGASNLIEHRDEWRSYPFLASIAYGLGDLLCHQRADRSYTWGGNQAPIDARLTGMFLGGVVGFALALRVPPRPRVQEGLQAWTRRTWPPRLRMWHLWVLGLAPVALDGLAQLLTAYESHNLTRLWTGAWAGLAGAFLVGTGFDALARPLPIASVSSPAERGDARSRGHGDLVARQR